MSNRLFTNFNICAFYFKDYFRLAKLVANRKDTQNYPMNA